MRHDLTRGSGEPTMTTYRYLLLVILAMVLLGCQRMRSRVPSRPPADSIAAKSDEAHPATVTALRYRRWVSRSAFEGLRGYGYWIEELWFPDWKIVANADPDAPLEPARLNAFASERPLNYAEDHPVFIPEGADPESIRKRGPTEEVDVPWDLAQRIRAAATLRERYHAAREAIGPELRAAGLLRDISSSQ
jgi:hypothetical protein